jgi:tetratricopeptide (TPR) repeat protein
MVVKQRPPQKPRPPSKTLWAIVHRISDAHWQQLKAYSQAYGKNSMQFRLMDFLREMPFYDPQSEKREFADCNLASMRHAAKRWLFRSAIKLGLYLGELQADVLGVDVYIQWECFDDAMDLIERAKALAVEQKDYARLTRLYQQELEIARKLYAGDDLIEEMERIGPLVIESAKLQSLGEELHNNAILFVEINKLRFNLTGIFDFQSAENYLRSEFHQQNIDDWPTNFQLQKLHIDESNHIFLDQFPKAIEVASRILEIYNTHDDIRAERKKDHAKILFRLSGINSKIGNLEQGLKVLEAFRAVDPVAEENREFYLIYFLHTLFKVGFDTGNMALAAEGATIWEDQKDFFVSMALDNTCIGTMLCVCSFHVANGDIQKARSVFSLLFKVEDMIQPIWAQAIYKLLHIIILLGEDDDIGLQSHGKNYKRQLRRHPSAALGLTILKRLCKPKHIYKPKSLLNVLPKVLEILILHQESDETSYKPFLAPLIHWGQSTLAKLERVDNQNIISTITDSESH